MRTVYLDHMAATPLLPEARAAMMPYFSAQFGNPQSRHALGLAPRAAIASARADVARLISASPSEITFTASGSEANNLALRGVLAARQRKGRHLITSAIEHFSVAHPMRRLEREGYEVTWLPVDRNGRVNPDAIARALRPDTALVSILHANNEVGTLQPIKEIAARVRASGALFHSDAVGTVGIIPVDVNALGVDLAAFAAQSFGGPKGAGALYVRQGTRLAPLIEGGVQEGGRRAGTENVAAIVGMGVAASAAWTHLSAQIPKWCALRARLIAGLLQAVDRIHLTGDPRHRLPHIASFAVEFADGEALVRLLEKQGILCASGSSCSADALKISPVLTAMGFAANVAQGAIVLSLGRDTTDADIDAVLAAFPACVATLRAVSPLYTALRAAP